MQIAQSWSVDKSSPCLECSTDAFIQFKETKHHIQNFDMWYATFYHFPVFFIGCWWLLTAIAAHQTIKTLKNWQKVGYHVFKFWIWWWYVHYKISCVPLFVYNYLWQWALEFIKDQIVKEISPKFARRLDVLYGRSLKLQRFMSINILLCPYIKYGPQLSIIFQTCYFFMVYTLCHLFIFKVARKILRTNILISITTLRHNVLEN